MRKRLVTRTVKGLSVTVLCVNKDTRETSETDIIVTNKFKTEEKLLNYINSNFLSSPLWGAGVIKTEPIVKRYGMTEDDFVKHASEMITNKKGDE